MCVAAHPRASTAQHRSAATQQLTHVPAAVKLLHEPLPRVLELDLGACVYACERSMRGLRVHVCGSVYACAQVCGENSVRARSRQQGGATQTCVRCCWQSAPGPAASSASHTTARHPPAGVNEGGSTRRARARLAARRKRSHAHARTRPGRRATPDWRATHFSQPGVAHWPGEKRTVK